MKYFVLVIGVLMSISCAVWAIVGVSIGGGYLGDHGKDIAAYAAVCLWIVIVGLGIMALYVRSERREERRRALHTTGVTADGVVRSIHATGTTGNFESVVLKLDLEVRPPSGPAFIAHLKEQFVQSALPMAGDHLEVVYDPAHPQTVMLAKTFDAGISAGMAPRVIRRADFDPAAIPPVPPGWEIGVRRTLVITFGLIGLGSWGIALDAILENPGDDAAIYVALGFGLFGAIFGGTAFGAVAKGIRRMRRARREHQLFITGQRVTGVLTEIEYNPRLTINDVLTPVHFSVSYPGPDGAPRAIRTKWLMLMASIPLPGDLVQVAYDPARPDAPAFNTDWNTFVAGGRRMITERPEPGSVPPQTTGPVPPGQAAPVSGDTAIERSIGRSIAVLAVALGLILVILGIARVKPPASIINASPSALIVLGVVILVVSLPRAGRSRRLTLGADGQPRQADNLSSLAQLITQQMSGIGSVEQSWFAGGKQAVATITDVTQSFGSLNTMNVPVTLQLHVTPTDEPPFDTETTLLLAINALPSPGDTVRVGYNPDDHRMIGVETRPIDTGGGRTVVTQA